MASIADIEIPLERIEALGRKLHLDEDGASTPEELAEYDRFIQETTQSAEESQWARLGIALVLGIISREEAAELAKEIDELTPNAQRAAQRAAAEQEDEDLIEELRVLASEAADFPVDRVVAERIFTEDDHILKEADYWGSSDTVVRERSHKVFSRALIGRDWPRYADGLTDEEFDEFLAELKIAHDRLLAELQQTQKD